MNVESFLRHHGLDTNPFDAEEARHDPVFDRISGVSSQHPDFGKILGNVNQPATAVVFGEKGSGKTAIRLMIGRRVAEHNESRESQRCLLVAYDDFNPYLDRLMNRAQRKGQPLSDARVSKILQGVRLEDHQDAILSLAVTKIVDAVVGDPDPEPEDGGAFLFKEPPRKQFKTVSRQTRSDLAVLAAMYDQPRRGSTDQRWGKLKSSLRLGGPRLHKMLLTLAVILLISAGGLLVADWWTGRQPIWWLVGSVASLIAATACGGFWLWHQFKLWLLTRRVTRELHTISRTRTELSWLLNSLKPGDLAGKPWPRPGDRDARYQLTHRLIGVLKACEYAGLMVMVDRVDEPTSVAGQPERMMNVVWPMLDNKFLQQRNVGIKLLLPIELRHALHRESPTFFQEARLDKQSLVDRLSWSGSTLFDLATQRLRACASAEVTNPYDMTLLGLFDSDVDRQVLIDALDQMQQPRDAFKFLYAVVQEHCKSVSDEDEAYRIPALTLNTVRRVQAQRVTDLYRGATPA